MPSKDKSGITKYTHVEHVLKVSDTYVGSMEKTEEEHWVYNQEENKMEKRKITYTPGEYKIIEKQSATFAKPISRADVTKFLVNALEDRTWDNTPGIQLGGKKNK